MKYMITVYGFIGKEIIMIAPSFQKNYTIESEPFAKGKKMYVTIKHARTGNTRDARWYSDAEFVKAFPKEKCAFTVSTTAGAHKVHDVLGFGGDADAITIYNGERAIDETYKPFRKSRARYHKLIGWYVIAADETPSIPNHSTLLLHWKEIGNEDGTLKEDEVVRKVIRKVRTNNVYGTFK